MQTNYIMKKHSKYKVTAASPVPSYEQSAPPETRLSPHRPTTKNLSWSHLRCPAVAVGAVSSSVTLQLGHLYSKSDDNQKSRATKNE